MPFTHILYDLDATLYASDNPLWANISYRIGDYLRTFLQLSEAEAAPLQRHYYHTYGTTLRGLQANHQIDARQYLDYVHDLPVRDYVQPDPALRQALLHLQLPKWIFTNSDQAHTQRVLDALGIADCFDGLISIEALNWECKPNRGAYETALAFTGETDPRKIIFLDDSPRNLQGARDFGFYTILVGATDPHPAARLSILRPHDLAAALPEIQSWN